MSAFTVLGRPLGRRLGRRLRRTVQPRSVVPRGVRRAPRRSLPYEKIREEIMAIVADLPPDQQAMIPLAGTLPEIMVALGMLWAGIPFLPQISEDGGRTRLGGSVVDFKVFLGTVPIILRVQGDYWHSLPDRVLKDIVQFERLKRMGFLVVDAWESDIYRAYLEGRLTEYMREVLSGAV